MVLAIGNEERIGGAILVDVSSEFGRNGAVAVVDDFNDEDDIWLPGDFPEEGQIAQDVFISVFANYA